MSEFVHCTKCGKQAERAYVGVGHLHACGGTWELPAVPSTGEVVFRQATLAELFPPPATDTPAEREMPDCYWTLRQMLDGPPDQHSPHAWAEYASQLVREFENRAAAPVEGKP